MKRGLELIVFVSGMILMALEIVGGRLLTFDYGGSIYVWGAIIGVVLGGLSIGYYSGGRLADKKPKEEVLSLIILIAGLLILIIPLSYGGLVSLISDAPYMFGPLIIILLLFLLPSILLGMVSPFAIKLKVKNLSGIGRTSGNLYAIATIGSVVGTFLATFVLIFFIGLNNIFVLLSVGLMVSVLVLKRNKKFYFICLIVLLFVFVNVSGFVSSSDSELVLIEGNEKGLVFESFYGPVMVQDSFYEGENTRAMYISDGVMGEIYVEDTTKGVPGWEYLEIMIDISTFAQQEFNADDALILGVGAGVIAKRLSEEHKMNVDAVDINKVVLNVAEKYFGLTPSLRLELHTKDAREFLKNTDKKYDVINMDTFKYIDGDYVIPPHLTTQEYSQLIKAHLNENGIFILMMIEVDDFFDSEYATINSVFENVYVFDGGGIKVVAASDVELDFPEGLMGNYVNYALAEDAVIYTDDYVPLYGM